MESPEPEDQEQLPRRLGYGMVISAWVVALALLTLLFQPLLEGQMNPNRQVESFVTDQGVREVVLQRNRAGHYVANGEINHNPVVFLLDTGATDVAISAALAQRLQLTHGTPIRATTANGTVRAYKTRLDSVRLGEIELNNISASVLPGMGNVEVLLGMSFLKRLELIQRGSEMTLRQY